MQIQAFLNSFRSKITCICVALKCIVSCNRKPVYKQLQVVLPFIPRYRMQRTSLISSQILLISVQTEVQTELSPPDSEGDKSTRGIFQPRRPNFCAHVLRQQIQTHKDFLVPRAGAPPQGLVTTSAGLESDLTSTVRESQWMNDLIHYIATSLVLKYLKRSQYWCYVMLWQI
jgi:hypothetical protein